MRRVLSLWFPYLAIDRATRREPSLHEAPFAFTAAKAGRILLQSANARARAAGVAANMPLADARAVCPQLSTRAADSHADMRTLKALARWMERYSPLIAFDGQDGLFADTSGGAHLFGGETMMLAGLTGELKRFGLTARAALADTPGAAWALARYGNGCTIVDAGAQRVALAPLPVAALRIADDVTRSCRRLGVKTIGDLAPLPRAALASRFGLATLKRLDQALGHEDEPLRHIRFAPAPCESLSFAEPIGRTEDVEEALQLLLERLCIRLEEEEEGLRLGSFTIERVDNSRQKITIATTAPSRSPASLFRLFRDQLETLDAGFGIERLHMRAERCEPLAPVQLPAAGGQAPDTGQADAELVDRLINRFGYQQILRLAPAESHLPDRAWLSFSAIDTPERGPWNRAGMARPLRLLDRPVPIDTARHADLSLPPSTIRRQGRFMALTPLAGPERIEPEWWHDDPAWRSGVRDYWWVRADDGAHLWLFRTGGQGPHGAWFLHGLGG